MTETKLQTVIDKQLPEFIREDYGTFVQFLKAYYQYLDVVDKRNLKELRDIDQTLYDYITYINGELGFSTSPDAVNTNIDPRLFLRKSKQAFISKGTEESYKFLFRVLYNKDAQISYPWDSVLKTSDGKWNQDTSIFVQFPTTMTVNEAEIAANSYVGNSVVVNGAQTAISVYVLKVLYIRDRVYEISLDKNFYGKINANDTITYKNIISTVIQTTIGYSIESPGTGFSLGDLIVGNTIAGSQVITQLLKVTKVDINGGILALSTLTFGAGYSDEFFLLASKQNVVSASGASNISLNVSGTPTFSIDDNSAIANYSDYGYIISPTYFPVENTYLTCAGTISVTSGTNIVGGVGTLFNNGSINSTEQVNVGDILQTTAGVVIGTVASIQSTTQLTLVSNAIATYTASAFRIPVVNYADPGYAGDIRQSFYQDTTNTGSNTSNGYALIRFTTGAVAKYQGYYTANDGFISDSIMIQDSKYYQKYSYLITVNEKLDSYRGYVNSFIHPAGVAGYSEYQIQETYAPGLSASQTLEQYISKATYTTINKAIINEYVSPIGLGGSFKFNPYDLEAYMAQDYNPENYATFTEA